MGKVSIKKILVPLDGSKNSLRGLDTAIYFARHLHATITGMFVLDRTPEKEFRRIEKFEKKLLKKEKKFLDEARTRTAKKGIMLHEKISFGDPAYSVIDYAKKGKFDLIVIGARGQGSLKELFFGSVSNYVIHKARVPVVIVK